MRNSSRLLSWWITCNGLIGYGVRPEPFATKNNNSNPSNCFRDGRRQVFDQLTVPERVLRPRAYMVVANRKHAAHK
jgi:hypothetical protein